MRIATLQFGPTLGDVQGNIRRADEILANGRVIGGHCPRGTRGVKGLGVDVLVLPELAFTGYNFPSREAIRPYLEPAGEGISGIWARETAQRLGCKVCVGYPEIETDTEEPRENETDNNNEREKKEKYYNSLLVVSETGEVILNYRKSFLYYTDETWACEGDVARGFHELTFAARNPTSESEAGSENKKVVEKKKIVATSFGICMDINPYRFEAPYTAWEFATRVLDSNSQLVILSMAWLTLLSREELDALADKPEMDTFNYWVQRFLPLVRRRMGHELNLDSDDGRTKKIVLVFANRVGEEGAGDGGGIDARYAGTSAVVAVSQRQRTDLGSASESEGLLDPDAKPFNVKILCWGMMGATTEGICFADTTAEPEIAFQLVKAAKSTS